MKSLTLKKQKSNVVLGLIIIKVNVERLERVMRKFLRNYFTLTVLLMAIAALKIGSNAKKKAQLKERETFLQHRLKTFYPRSLNEKEEYLCWHNFLFIYFIIIIIIIIIFKISA